MFGKPQWFRKTKERGWLMPSTWQGWAYLLLGIGITLGPVTILGLRGQWIEAMVWILVASGFAVLELRQLRKEIRDNCDLDHFFQISAEDETSSVMSEGYELIPPRR